MVRATGRLRARDGAGGAASRTHADAAVVCSSGWVWKLGMEDTEGSARAPPQQSIRDDSDEIHLVETARALGPSSLRLLPPMTRHGRTRAESSFERRRPWFCPCGQVPVIPWRWRTSRARAARASRAGRPPLAQQRAADALKALVAPIRHKRRLSLSPPPKAAAVPRPRRLAAAAAAAHALRHLAARSRDARTCRTGRCARSMCARRAVACSSPRRRSAPTRRREAQFLRACARTPTCARSTARAAGAPAALAAPRSPARPRARRSCSSSRTAATSSSA